MNLFIKIFLIGVCALLAIKLVSNSVTNTQVEQAVALAQIDRFRIAHNCHIQIKVYGLREALNTSDCVYTKNNQKEIGYESFSTPYQDMIGSLLSTLNDESLL